MIFEDSASTWIASRGSPDTRAAYARDLKLWLEHCSTAGAAPSDPPMGVVVAFRDELQRARAPLTVRRVLATLSAVFRAVHPTGKNPFAERLLARPPNTEYSRTEAVSDDDARRMLAIAAERGEAPLRDVALLAVLYSTGMRRVSLVSIRRDAIRQQDDTTVVWHYVKGGKEKPSELSDEAAQAVRAWLATAPASRWLFSTLDGARRLSPQGVTNIVASVARAAGLDVHPHQFRSAFITRALDAGIPLPRVQAAAHHEESRSTMRYDRSERGIGVVGELAKFRDQARNASGQKSVTET